MTEDGEINNPITTVTLDIPIISMHQEAIREYIANKEVLRFIKSKFKRMSRPSVVNLTRMILYNQFPIKAEQILEKPKSFIWYNQKIFNEKDELKIDVITDLKRSLNGFLLEIGKEPIIADTEEEEDELPYILNCRSVYDKTRKLIGDEGGDIDFVYDFDKPDMETIIPTNKNTLQRCLIQILSTNIKFHYPVEFVYVCPQCGLKTWKIAHETASTHNKIRCEGIYSFVNNNGETKTRTCGNILNPDNEISDTKDAYFYDMSYEDEEGNKHTVSSFSFLKLTPGFYECVLFNIKNPRKTELYQIMAVKPIQDNIFVFPEKNPKENYLFTLQKTFDNFIKQQTGVEIYGLYPIKVALIIQKIVSEIKLRLLHNIQIVGDPSTGKSTVLKYYSFLLNNVFNLSTNGMSTSIPGLRGTKHTVSLFGKEQPIITTGYLGTYKTIHIDEIGENKELMKNLKTFILEDNYSYDKAGGSGIFYKRRAQLNVSENLDYEHVGQYRGSIKKAYKDGHIKISKEEKIEWDENWDLHLPMYKYDNPYLRKIIQDKRIEYKLKHQFWIDGYDYALHQRFPFYFYLVNEKKDEKLKKIIKENVSRNTINENLLLVKALKTKEIDNFFLELIKFKESEEDIKGFSKVDEILEQYGVITDSRTDTFYYTLVRISRISNKRLTIEEEDLNLLRWFLEKTHCKLDVLNTANYNIEGPPDIQKQKEIDKMIENDTKNVEDEFGLPDGEFLQ